MPDQKITFETVPVTIDSLPVALHAALCKFDLDGNGAIDTSELLRAAEMYAESKKENKRLMKVIGGLLFVLVCMLVAIGLITNLVVQSAKETVQSSDGVTLVAGTTDVAKVGKVVLGHSIFDAFSFDADKLDSIENIRFLDSEGDLYSYRPESWTLKSAYMTFKTSDGTFIKVTDDKKLSVTDATGKVIVNGDEAHGRRLQKNPANPEACPANPATKANEPAKQSCFKLKSTSTSNKN